MKLLAMRWLRFNLVGAMGIVVQLGCLAALRPHLHYLAATALAVELAVLHNFLWHERFTWRDRGRPGTTSAARLVRFHLANGAVSILGNVGLTWLLAGRCHLPLLVANGTAIALCSAANFASGEWFVFRRANASSR